MSSTVAAPVVLSLLHGIRADRLNRIFTLDLIQYVCQVSAIILRPGGICGAFSDGGLFFLKIGWAELGFGVVGKRYGGSLVHFRKCALT
jgi:hypothetical protein